MGMSDREIMRLQEWTALEVQRLDFLDHIRRLENAQSDVSLRGVTHTVREAGGSLTVRTDDNRTLLIRLEKNEPVASFIKAI